MSRRNEVQWNHPVHGRVTERLCSEHESGLIAALTFLGIGCGGTRAEDGPCDRCLRYLRPPRVWIQDLAVQS